MRKWRKNEIKTGPLQRMFSSNMPLLWYCYAIVACSTKRGALEENIQLAVGAGAARYWGGGGTVLYRNSTKGGALEDFLQLPRGPVVGGKHTTCHSFGTGWHAPFIRVNKCIITVLLLQSTVVYCIIYIYIMHIYYCC